MEANRVALKRTVHQRSPGLWARIIGIYTILILATLTAWSWAELEFHQQPVFLGTALLAYSFGLRHAFHADHIAAIDNVTRKLMQAGKLPVSAGFWFAMGHSAVVVLATAVIGRRHQGCRSGSRLSEAPAGSSRPASPSCFCLPLRQ